MLQGLDDPGDDLGPARFVGGQQGPAEWSRTQHPFGRGRAVPFEDERGVHRFQFDVDESRAG